MFGLSFKVPGVDDLIVNGTIHEFSNDQIEIFSLVYRGKSIYTNDCDYCHCSILLDDQGFKYFILDENVFSNFESSENSELIGEEIRSKTYAIRIYDYIRSTVAEAVSKEYMCSEELMKAIIRDGIENVVVDMDCEILDSFGVMVGIGVTSSSNPRILAKCKFVESYLYELYTNYKLKVVPIVNELINGDSMTYITGQSFYTSDFVSSMQRGTLSLKIYTVPHTDGKPDDYDYTLDYFKSHGLSHLFVGQE